MNLKDLLAITTLKNTDLTGAQQGYDFDTHDYIYLDSRDEAITRFIDNQAGDNANLTFPTDYAILNKAIYVPDLTYYRQKIEANHSANRTGCSTWLRSGFLDIFNGNTRRVDMIDEEGHIDSVNMHDELNSQAIRPCLQLDIDACLAVLKQFAKQNVRVPYFQINNGKMNFGMYPQNYVGTDLNYKLEERHDEEKLTLTGKTYIGRYNKKHLKLAEYNEYVIDNEKYVRIGKGFKGTYNFWLKVEPIVWIIDNWQDLPKTINPEGTGSAKTIKLRTDSAIISGIPFYPNTIDEYNHMWQNSSLRGYLNGYNVNSIEYNGAKAYSAPRGGNFMRQNFLTEAMSDVVELIREIPFQEKKKFVPTIEAKPTALKNFQTKEKD